MRATAPAMLAATLALCGCAEGSAPIGQLGALAPPDTGDPPVDNDGDGFDADVDCDDDDAAVFPGADEVCDGIDNDCAAGVDIGAIDATTWYTDGDGDGHGDPASSEAACAQPVGTVANANDCDDADAAVSPDTVWYSDADGDGYGDPGASQLSCPQPAGTVSNAADCDDADVTTSPDTIHYADVDGDGYGDPNVTSVQCAAPAGTVRVDGDCDDADAARSPGTVWYADSDGDGYGAAGSTLTQCAHPAGYVADATDCDDTAASSHPGAPELCDGTDHDCDSDGYDSESSDASIWYRDVDGDGFGRLSGLPTPACTQPSGFVADHTDCVDTDGTAYPGSHWPETPNDGVDQDCDGFDHCTDLDCDGYADIVFANWRLNGSTYTMDSYIYTGTGSGYAWSDRTAMATTGAFAADVADYDQDGYLDVVLATFLPSDYTTDSVVMWGSATGHSAGDSDALATTGARSVCSGDFDADGYPDALFPAFVTNGPTFAVDSVVHYGASAGFVGSTALSTVGAFDSHDPPQVIKMTSWMQ